MPWGLKRFQQSRQLHFVTFSCYRRRPLLNSPARRELFARALEDTRRSYRFLVTGYVVMPEHVHLLLGEPQRGNPSLVMQAIKQGFARRLLSRLRPSQRLSQPSFWSGPVERGRIWQPRFYDFVVFSERKRIEKLHYMHRNPVQRGLVLKPEEWPWSSFRHYAYGEPGPVLINEIRKAELHIRKIS